ncbi:MAG: GspE/PulE/PilB domain-containing protein, partial [Archangium sp.]
MPSHLAQTLIAQGLLPQDKAEEALRHQTAQGGSIDTALLERRLLPEPEVLHALGEASGLRPVNLADFEPNADVASFIPPKISDRLCVVPLSLDGNTLHVACGYPVPKKELEEVGFLLGKPLELWVATEVRVREWISVIYRQPLAPRYSALLTALDPERMGTAAEPAPAPKPAPDDSALTLEMVERLARSVAAEPFPLAQPPLPPPQPQPQRVNGAPPAPAASTAPAQPPRPPAPAAPTAPPHAATPPVAAREPLRLNMPEPARPAAPPQAPPAPAARPAAPPPQSPAQQPAPTAARPPVQQSPVQAPPASPAAARPPVQQPP